MPPVTWWLQSLLLATLAFGLRAGIHWGRVPGGVDTWYYLAYADAFRRRPSFDVRLPQYLLQDERQSYPPLFPSVLALLPASFLRRFFWTISPGIDCLHLLLLHFVTFRLTDSLAVAGLAGAAYAFTPHLVAESRSLSARPFGALLHSAAMICLFKYVLGSGALLWLLAAVGTGAALYLSSAAMAAAYGFVNAVLSLAFDDPRFLGIASAALIAAILLSGGHYLRVIRNYVHALAYWRRNRKLYGAHPVHDSPIYGADLQARPMPVRPGFMGGTTLTQLVRLFGENPFLLALPLAPRGFEPWGPRLWVWAVSLALLSLVATVLPPLRAFGPGRSYMKAGVFPTAYSLAFGIGSIRGFTSAVGVATLVGLSFSLGAIWFYYAYVRGRDTEHTASTPPALTQAVAALAQLPPGGVFVLPYMYADYVAYHSGRPVVWGGHCGDLSRLAAIAPVIREPIGEILKRAGARYVLLDTLYVSASVLGSVEPTKILARSGTIEIHGIAS